MGASALVFTVNSTQAVYSQDLTIVQFGRAEPSVPEDGSQGILEDPAKGFSVQTYAQLPKYLATIFGMHLSEAHFTANGVPIGRRLSLFRGSDLGKVSPENRLAFFDFNEQGVLERYEILQPPKDWFDPKKAPISVDSSDDAKFFHRLLYEAGENALPLKTSIQPSEPVRAPKGLLSPQVLRPIFDLQVQGEGVSQVSININRTYNAEGVLERVGFSVNQVLAGPDGEMTGARELLKLDAKVLEAEATSSVFQSARPCTKLAQELLKREGKN